MEEMEGMEGMEGAREGMGEWEALLSPPVEQGRARRSACPGGAGKFGFNTYNLMAFMLMSFNQVSNVIVNSNNNRNNNNNNDFQATFGSVNTNTQTAEATQTGSTMTMITVPPTGTPIVVPLGRLLEDGRVELEEGVEEEGVAWESPLWRVTDSGLIFYKTKASRRVVRGLQYFGTVGADNMLRLLPNYSSSPVTLDQVLLPPSPPPPYLLHPYAGTGPEHPSLLGEGGEGSSSCAQGLIFLLFLASSSTLLHPPSPSIHSPALLCTLR